MAEHPARTGRRPPDRPAAGHGDANDALLDLVERNLVEPREAYLKAVDNSSLLASLKVKGHATDFMGEG